MRFRRGHYETGAIVGARHGLAAFPQAWLDGLTARPLIEAVLQEVLASKHQRFERRQRVRY
ncbi:MAG: hypothetical protein ACLPSH_12530 [Vulcanimicrobiaceae bacterium]